MFALILKDILSQLCLDAQLYNTHILKIGAATGVKQDGISISHKIRVKIPLSDLEFNKQGKKYYLPI